MKPLPFLFETSNNSQTLPKPELFSSIEPIDPIVKESFEMFLKQLHKIPIAFPDFLIINNLRADFISLNQYHKLELERIHLDPILQPWAGSPSNPNRIITLFAKNGSIYLIRAKYDTKTNIISEPA